MGIAGVKERLGVDFALPIQTYRAIILLALPACPPQVGDAAFLIQTRREILPGVFCIAGGASLSGRGRSPALSLRP
jgi:hypothetical protein